ncbi:MAG: hypothetical protein JJ974_03235 [Phycisphaerales bacterium]|nr:hypothetical protein [Phycisphaerales bacterium]
MRDQRSILRWALPPGVSIIIHAALLTLLIIIGSRAASIIAEEPKTRTLPLAELEVVAAPPSTPETNDDEVSQDPDPSPSREQAPTPQQPNLLDQSARSLQSPTPIASQAMSAATLDQLVNQSSTLSAEPSSAPSSISFAGVSTGAARSIVYVIDTSGATMTSLSYIRERLLQSIDRLSPTQRFQVIAFRKLGDSTHTSPTLATSKGKLPRATRANKQAVADWLNAMPARGQSNPVDGLAAALELEPDMILLISRGIERTEAPWAGGLKSVRQRLDELNPLDPISGTRPAVIKTIQLLDEDPTGIMRTIGVFHGDGHNDHQVITYNQLVSPDPEPAPAPPTTTDNRLTAADEQLAALKAAGSYYRATSSIPSKADLDSIENALRRINAMLEGADPSDPRSALLLAETVLLKQTPNQTNESITTLIDSLTEAVFVSPDLDARRRIALAQLTSDTSDLQTLLDEQNTLNYSPIISAHAILILSSTQPIPSDVVNQPPFTTDPAWALLLAESQTAFRFQSAHPDPLEPLLDLRSNYEPLVPQIDASIQRIVKHESPDLGTLPELARFIIARANITQGTDEDRLHAIDALLGLTDSTDESLAEESLWIACLGSRALNSRASTSRLISAATVLASRFPHHPGAADALAGAIDAARAQRDPRLVPLLRQTIALFPDRIEIDLWRLELIQQTSGPEQFELIKSLTPATRESDLGAEILHKNALDANTSDPLSHAISTASTLDALRSPLAVRWHRTAAELEISTDPRSAASRLSKLIQKNPDPNDPDLELIYARALLGDQRHEQALSRLTSLSASLNNNASKHFWHCWTLILETTLEHGNQRDRAAARAHLTRLKLIDQNLGPEPYRFRLTRVANTLHSEP